MTPSNAQPILSISGSAKMNAVALFEGLHLSLMAGQWTCLLGTSGVGKSTILRLIAGLETHVDFLGKIETPHGDKIQKHIAYMAQDDLLMPWSTVLDNVLLGAKLRGEPPNKNEAMALLERLGLSQHFLKRPDQLSGGQRQRVALARTLMENKTIILLDEPFSALDAKTRSEMQDLSVDLLKGKTILLVTHDPAEAARLGHQILIMQKDGLHQMPAPQNDIPRSVDDSKTLKLQGNLLKFLRGGH